MAKKSNTEQFIKKAREIHGDKYDYSKVIYVNNRTKICIICPIHGEFYTTPNAHLGNKRGCRFCGYEKLKVIKKSNTEEFIKKAREIHGDKYDYSKVIYIDNITKVCIICPIHGEFWQQPNNHLTGYEGCKYCAKRIMNTEIFIQRSKEIHGNNFDYSKVEYKNPKNKVCIICPIHGEFWQSPYAHLQGKGCSKCKNKSVLEKKIFLFFDKNNIKYESQKKFSWLGKQSLDFYLPDYNIAIECQGRQHFIDGCFTEPLHIIENRDLIKKQKCLKNGVEIIYIVNKNYKHKNPNIYNENNLFDVSNIEKILKSLKKNQKNRII